MIQLEKKTNFYVKYGIKKHIFDLKYGIKKHSFFNLEYGEKFFLRRK
jgi:hypothetical protein